jgi:branched-chain amino acid transport system permease protein
MNPNLDWLGFAEFSIIGLLSGGLLSLVALGFVLIYKGTKVVNFAMGEFMMLGAYFVYTAHAIFKLPLPIALVAALIAVSMAALAVERFILRPLSGQPVISALMATIGLAAAMHGGIDAIWGGQNLEMPQVLPRKPFIIGDLLIPGTVVWSFLLAVVVIGALTLYFRFSRTGVAMRAAASDPITAYALGIDVRRTQQLTWVFAGLVGAVAGVIVASMSSLSPALGSVALGVLAVIILGGLDSIAGAIIAGLIVGWLESVCVGLFGGKARDIVPYAVVLAILMVRPYGLFGSRDIERL